jgi:DNA-binding response OmpR family regulator
VDVTTVLICGPDQLMDELRGTMLARDGIDRIHVHGFQQALGMAVAARPELVVVDRDLPQAARLVEDLREENNTRRASIVVAARGELQEGELKLIDAGANALLRLPGDPQSDARLARLLDVAPRRHVRLPVFLEFDAFQARGGLVLHGTVLDLSRHGMLVHAATAVAVGTELGFELPLDDGDPQPIRGTCRVVRCAGEQEIGIAFEALQDDGAERLRRHVEE